MLELGYVSESECAVKHTLASTSLYIALLLRHVVNRPVRHTVGGLTGAPALYSRSMGSLRCMLGGFGAPVLYSGCCWGPCAAEASL